MKTSDFYFDLPEELIAQRPTSSRGESRLLVLDRASGRWTHRMFRDLPECLPPDSVLVFNNSRVRKARVFGTSENGGKVEFLLIRPQTPTQWEVLCRKAQKQRTGKTFIFPEGLTATVVADLGDGKRLLRFSSDVTDDWLERNGRIPLPPYIRRNDDNDDQNRYQTVYASPSGSLAAPTAGLHFTNEIMEQLKRIGIPSIPVTLHVGLGTFLPVRTERIIDHKMHAEGYEIPESSAQLLEKALAEGKSLTAVGTTSVRTLESAWTGHEFRRGCNETSLFITPGYSFGPVKRMITNFHTPESSLLMLVSAFAGYDLIREVYQDAIKERYRFYSYGDAMLIL